MPRKSRAPAPRRTRREQAQETRRRMVDAAADLILERGYAATTMADVAKHARVAVQTVYFTFHTKAALFLEVVLRLSGGSEAATPVMERAWIQEAREAPSPARALAILVENGTDLFGRLMPVWGSIQAACATDPAFAARFEAVVAARRQGMRALLTALAGRGALRAGVSLERAADTLFLLQSPQLLSLATTVLGWPAERFKAWTYLTMLPLLDEPSTGQAALRGLSFAADFAALTG